MASFQQYLREWQALCPPEEATADVLQKSSIKIKQKIGTRLLELAWDKSESEFTDSIAMNALKNEFGEENTQVHNDYIKMACEYVWVLQNLRKHGGSWCNKFVNIKSELTPIL